jgi:hypothetical protein
MSCSDLSRYQRAALFTVLLAALLSGCGEESHRSTPTAPASGNTPQLVSEAATPGTYERVTPHFPETVQYHGGSLESRLVVERDGTFALEYDSANWGRFSYAGTYAREGDWYVLDFEDWSAAGSWLARASFAGSCAEVDFNVLMELSGFESGRFCR